MNFLGKLVHYARFVVLFFTLPVMAEVFVLYEAYRHAIPRELGGTTQTLVAMHKPLIAAMESTASFLFTLSAPDSIPIQPGWMLAGHILGWFVSLLGWLMFPTLISIVLSRALSLDQDFTKLLFTINMRANTLDLTGKDRKSYIEEELKRHEA